MAEHSLLNSVMQCRLQCSPVIPGPTELHLIHIGQDEGYAPNWSLSLVCIRPSTKIQPAAMYVASNQLTYYSGWYCHRSDRFAVAADEAGDRSQWMRGCYFLPHPWLPVVRIFDWRQFVDLRKYPVAEAHPWPRHSGPSCCSTGRNSRRSRVVRHSYAPKGYCFVYSHGFYRDEFSIDVSANERQLIYCPLRLNIRLACDTANENENEKEN